MQEASEPYHEMSIGELAESVGELTESEDVRRVEINMALAEVYARLSRNPEGDETRQLHVLAETLLGWLRGDDDRRMGGPRHPDSGPGCGTVCMCSTERLEARATRGD